MPKRPCSVTLTTDEGTILCADKFGDVYALPLKETESPKTERINETPLDNERPDAIPQRKQYVPAASLSTVHTKRNQQALKNQQYISNKVTEKKALDFAHELLLGHVSLLTDLAHVTVKPQESSSNHLRNYIITSDRDEHIRVSRGLPQAHIIEGYCLGHTEFISRMCIPSWQPEILVSGGGDDFLIVWDWLTGSVRQKVDLKNMVAASMDELSEKTREDGSTLRTENQATHDSDTTFKIAVSGIWATQVSDNMKDDIGELVVACEGQVDALVLVTHTNRLFRVPVLFIYHMTSSRTLEYRQYLLLEGNVLDVAILHGQSSFLVSMDSVHIPFSMTMVEKGGSRPALVAYSYIADYGRWVRGHGIEHVLAAINDWDALQDCRSAKMDSNSPILSNLLYGIENLRKRGQEE